MRVFIEVELPPAQIDLRSLRVHGGGRGAVGFELWNLNIVDTHLDNMPCAITDSDLRSTLGALRHAQSFLDKAIKK